MTTKMKPIDMGKIVKQHRGKWVAIVDTGQSAKVVVSGNTRKQVQRKCKELGIERPIITHIPSQLVVYVL